MPFPTAAQNKIQRLYHWQRFNMARFEEQMKNGTVYCSSPRDFNDPWDCRPFFNTNLLADENERPKHIDWAVKFANGTLRCLRATSSGCPANCKIRQWRVFEQKH